ncbi:urease accessory protein [Ekhidna sp.]|uniref:urease accessory protein n=1 Tax=Ekhidna sp. TaxID=2608089 RepID=UPI003296B724
MTITTLLFAVVVGFNHAFEADHVLAVGNIANRRTSFLEAMRDGLLWGLGHTSTILVVGCVIILGKLTLNIGSFEYLEMVVGVTLVGLGFFRIRKSRKAHPEKGKKIPLNSKLAYSIGLLHGLAGSGAVVLIAMSEIESSSMSIIYMLLFGAGSIFGMIIVAILFKIPIGDKSGIGPKFQNGFILLSGLLCIGYGLFMIYNFSGL